MDKNAIKKFAVWARTELIARVSLKGVKYGFTEDNIEDANADSVGGNVLTADEKKQRQALIAEINDMLPEIVTRKIPNGTTTWKKPSRSRKYRHSWLRFARNTPH